MTQEFHLSITSLGSDRYLIRTEDTAAGVPVAETQVEWPVEDWLRLAQPAMDDPIVGLLKGQSNVGNDSLDLHKLGATLYSALFHEGAIRESWLRAQGIAQNREEILRFRLGLKESRLQRLPWEVLHHDGHPLTTRSDLTFTRYAANFLVGQTLDAGNFLGTDTLLRVLMVIASPSDQDHLKLLHEVKHVRELLQIENGATLPIEITVLEQPDRSTLAQALEQGNYQVLHYAGHSDLSDSGGDLSLVNRQTGLTERLSGDDLAGLLVNNHVVLTVFNSCRSGHTAGDDAEMDWRQQNLVQALVNRGVPGVIAMAERIPDEVAIAFTQLFYKNLRKGYPIDLSLSRTRQGLISAFGSNQNYWALPILYLQPDFDGYLTKSKHKSEDSLAGSEREWTHTETPEVTIETSRLEAETTSNSSPKTTPTEKQTLNLLEQLESSTPTEEEDDVVASFVKQLSETSTVAEEPLMPAAKEERLVDDESERAGMAIYDTLPEVPTQKGAANTSTPTPLPDSQTPPFPNGDRPSTRSPQQLFPTTKPQQTPERSPLIWFALGLIGVVAVMGLGALALRWTGVFSEAPTPEPEPSTQPLTPTAGADAGTLLDEAQQAIQEQRYGDARDAMELALIQELTGRTAPNEVSDAIWTLITDESQPDLSYIRGRLAWQQMAQLGEDEISFEREQQQRQLAAQARDAWEQTSDTFLKGRIARGFAYYFTGDLDSAIENWEAALALYDEQRQRQPDPADSTPVDTVILHAYAGLVMARTDLAELNLDGLAEDERLAEASEADQTRLRDEAERERSVARETFLRLQELDSDGQMAPEQLQIINQSEETWNNWLWTDALLNDWRPIYREWDAQN